MDYIKLQKSSVRHEARAQSIRAKGERITAITPKTCEECGGDIDAGMEVIVSALGTVHAECSQKGA